MKKLKVGAVLILVILLVTLVTLRFTGLEPEYLDLTQFRTHHMSCNLSEWACAMTNLL